jgi:micrococcal nuclease
LVKKGDTVKIGFDIHQRDKYRRLFGYVYLDNRKMLNEEILRAGYASLLTRAPNVKYVERFRKAYQEARESKRGLWK